MNKNEQFQSGNAKYQEGTRYRESFQFDEAIASYKEALEHLTPVAETALIICLHYDLALAYDFMSAPGEALESFQNAVRLYYDLERKSSKADGLKELIEQVEEQLSLMETCAFDKNEGDYLKYIKARPWKTKETVFVFIDRSDDTGYDSQLADLIWAGFAIWLKPEINIECLRTEEIDDAQITIHRVNAKLGPAAGQTLFEDYVDSNRKTWLKSASIRMFTSSYFLKDIDSTEKQKFSSLACHEAGHALGLDGHSPYGEDLMYFKAPWPEPSFRDVNTLARLYEK